MHDQEFWLRVFVSWLACSLAYTGVALVKHYEPLLILAGWAFYVPASYVLWRYLYPYLRSLL